MFSGIEVPYPPNYWLPPEEPEPEIISPEEEAEQRSREIVEKVLRDTKDLSNQRYEEENPTFILNKVKSELQDYLFDFIYEIIELKQQQTNKE